MSDRATPPPNAGASDKPARPQSVALPSPQYSRNRPQSPLYGSGSGDRYKAPSPSLMSPAGGMMSPGTHPNQFVFPIRSVFQSRGEAEPSSSRRPTSSRSPNDGRRFSDAFAEAINGDAGMQTIHELLAKGSSGKPKDRDGHTTPSAPAVATFTSKGANASPRPSPDAGTRNADVFFPSASSSQRVGEEAPFFTGQGKRRYSGSSSTHSKSMRTVRSDDGKGIKNDSTPLPGSGMSQQRAPVGQPQGEPAEVNFKHYTHDDSAFAGAAKQEDANPPPRGEQPASDAPPLHAPVAQRAAKSSGSGSIQSAIERNEHGVQSLVQDFASIVRLGDVGSGGSAATVASGSAGAKSAQTRDSDPGSAGGGTTEARLARQNRSNARDGTRRDPVRKFIEDQSHMTDMSDPNSATPQLQTSSDEDSASDGVPSSDADATDSSVAGATDGSGAPDSQADDAEPPEIVTIRFEHVQTDDGHHVVVGREGVLKQCEDEPITTPGAVQGFGVLIVLDEDFETGKLVVRQVSENATELLGLSPRYLFQLDCFTKILTAEQEDLLRDNIEYLPEPGTGREDEEGPQVFLLSGFGEPGSDESDESTSDAGNRRREWTCWIAAHRPKQPKWDKVDEHGRPVDPPDLIVLEFELEKDFYNPLMQPFEPASTGTETPDSGSMDTVSGGSGQASSGSVPTIGSLTSVPSTSTVHSASAQIESKTMTQASSHSRRRAEPMGLDGIEIDHPIDRLIESTTNHARPLRALERMRRAGGAGSGGAESADSPAGSGARSRRSQRQRQPGGATGTMDVFAVLGQINDQLGAATDLDTFLKITVGMVQDLCRFHRVLIYQFDESMNGQVVAEIVEWGKTTDLFKGLMFPASDIPAQARDLYKINKVRLLYDRSQTTARLVLRSKEDLDHPLDMTHCYLRAMSPIHIKCKLEPVVEKRAC
ncbi:hypothetical protein Q5752_004946 [Cryptotrichosporon argae]